MKTKTVISVFFVIVVLSCLISCGVNNDAQKKNMRVVTDMLGREVEIPLEINRIVGLRAGALRLLSYMDASNIVVGIEEGENLAPRPYTIIFPELLKLQSLGPIMGGDAELILASRPDIIFITYTTVEDANNLQNKTGIPVVALECTELATESELLYGSLRLIGEILNKNERADFLINYISEMISELDERTFEIPDNEKPSAYIGGLSYSNSYGISATHPDFSSFLFVNAKNVASEIDRRLSSHVKGTFVDIEQILLWNPDNIFIDVSGLEIVRNELKSNKVLNSELIAVQNNNIFTILRHNNYATNYEYVLLNSWYIGKILYPEQFSDICIEEKTDEILSVFYGKHPGFDNMKAGFALKQINKSDL